MWGHKETTRKASPSRAHGAYAAVLGWSHLKRAILIVLACAVACGVSFFVAPETSFGTQDSQSYGLVVQNGDTTGNLAAGSTTTWSDFRGSYTNNAITDAKTPRKKSEAGLLWTARFDNGYVSPEIIVNDEIIVTSGRGSNGIITKLDKKTGKTIAEAPMKRASTYSLMPPTYADGTVFVTLSNGGLEAFDVKTLKSKWYYESPQGGQGNCPVVYSDGLVYTGYWSGETAERSFVCVNAKTGKLVWEKKNAGGYYWAGALVVGEYLLFGCDDGKSVDVIGSSKVRCVDKKTGKEISSVSVKGDQRSTIVYDSELGKAFFTSKPGWLYSVDFDDQTGSLSGLNP